MHWSGRWRLYSGLRSGLISISALLANPLSDVKNLCSLLKSIIIDLFHWLMNWSEELRSHCDRRHFISKFFIAFDMRVALVWHSIVIRKSSKQKFNLKLWTQIEKRFFTHFFSICSLYIWFVRNFGKALRNLKWNPDFVSKSVVCLTFKNRNKWKLSFNSWFFFSVSDKINKMLIKNKEMRHCLSPMCFKLMLTPFTQSIVFLD